MHLLFVFLNNPKYLYRIEIIPDDIRQIIHLPKNIKEILILD